MKKLLLFAIMFITQGASADLVMLSCPYSLDEESDQYRAFELYDLSGQYNTNIIPITTQYTSAPINAGTSNWSMVYALHFFDKLFASASNSNLVCRYAKALNIPSVASWIPNEYLDIKKTVPYCACSAGMFYVLGNTYQFACQTTGCVGAGGNSNFSDADTSRIANQLRTLESQVKIKGIAPVSNRIRGLDTSDRNVKDFSRAFIEAAKKSGTKIFTETEYNSKK